MQPFVEDSVQSFPAGYVAGAQCDTSAVSKQKGSVEGAQCDTANVIQSFAGGVFQNEEDRRPERRRLLPPTVETTDQNFISA